MMRVLLLACLWLLWAAPALAGVRIDFYSRDTDVRFPHAFVVLQGTLDATGEAVDANYGFTPRLLTPLVLLGPIDGQVVSVGPEYWAQAHRHFSLELSDAEYARVMAVVEDWSSRPQPSYRLDEANCVGFVAAIAAALGLQVQDLDRYMRRPTSFLRATARRNAALLQSRASLRTAAGPPAEAVTGPAAGSGAPRPRSRAADSAPPRRRSHQRRSRRPRPG